MSRPRIVIELGPGRLRAISAINTPVGLRVKAVLNVSRPDLDVDVDEDSFIEWMRTKLDDSGIVKGPCTVAIPRGDAVIKQLSFPTRDEGELAGMVRFAMAEELHLAEQEVQIDFLPTQVSDDKTDVLAAALPRSSLDRAQRRMRALNRPPRALSPRFLGASLLVGDEHGGTTACVDVIADGIEFTLVQGEHVRFVRGVPLPHGSAQEMAEVVATETKRTWLSWQVESDFPSIDRVVLTGEPEVVAAAREAVTQAVGMPVHLFESHADIDLAGHDVGGLWPLVGLLLRQHQRHPLIDFMKTRQPPDHAAERRIAVLGVLGVMLVILALVWTIGSISTRGLRTQLDRLTSEAARLEAPWLRYHRNRYRLRHLELWNSKMPQWQMYMADMIDRLQPAGSLVVDEVSGVFDWEGVDAPRKEGVKDWSVVTSRRLIVEAEAASREVGEAFRESWIDDPDWEVATSGADKEDGHRLPFGVTIRLATPEETKETVPAEAKDASP